jgi:hypothetical protein
MATSWLPAHDASPAAFAGIPDFGVSNNGTSRITVEGSGTGEWTGGDLGEGRGSAPAGG